MDILVVEDNRATRKMVRFALERRGHRVLEAEDARSAVVTVTESTPHLILQDLRLPDADGLVFVHELRELTGDAVPILAFSAEISGDSEALRAAGFAGAIAKPVQPARLAEQIESHFAPRSTRGRTRTRGETMRPARQAPLLSIAPSSHLAQRCAELASQLAIVEGMTAAVLEQPDVDVLLGELLTAWFNAGGLSGGALYLKQPDGSLAVRCLGEWQVDERAAASFFGNHERLVRAIAAGRELRLSGAELVVGIPPLRGFEMHEVLAAPLKCGETRFGALAAASLGTSWTAWQQLTRSVAQRIAQLCAHEQMRREQREATQSARRQAAVMTALVQNAADIIVQLDPDGGILFVNKVRNPGRPVLGVSVFEFMRPEERPRIRDILARVIANAESISYDVEASDTSGSVAWYSCRMSPVRQDGKVLGAVLICRDVSMQREIEARLRVADRMAAIGTLAAGVAHEINTPIQYVANNLDFVVACVKTLTATEEPERGMTRAFVLERLPAALADCEEGVKRVAAITHAMRTFSHPGSRDDQVDASPRAHQRHARHREARRGQARARDRGGEPGDHRARGRGERPRARAPEANPARRRGRPGDRARRGRSGPPAAGALQLRVERDQFTPAGGRVVVRTRAGDQGTFVVEVEDTGRGISAEDLPRLFVDFQQLGPRSEEGTGLGLALTKRLVEAQGGTVGVTSELGRGSRFFAMLPRRAAQRRAA